MKNAINWFEIPSIDFDRAVEFYNSIINWKLMIDDTMWMKMALFPSDKMEWIWGAIIYTPNVKPSQDWVTVYLNAWDNLDDMISKIEMAWWKIIIPKMDIWKEMWFIIQFIDSEWNRIGAHWMM